MMGALDACEACGAQLLPVSGWLSRCRQCGFLTSTLQAGSGTGIDGLESLRRANFELLLDALRPLGGVSGKRLLEVGSARGWFLEAACHRGAHVRGIEPDAANAQFSSSRSLSVETGFFPADLADRGPYDVIVFNDVLEHIPRPSTVMQAVEELLVPGGLAVVNLPSSHGVLALIARQLWRAGMHSPYERLWQKGFPSPHISYFNPANLRLLVERSTGMRQVHALSLPSVSRKGLWPRIRSSHPGPAGFAIFGGVWMLSFGLGVLPSDIHVGVFRKAETKVSRRE